MAGSSRVATLVGRREQMSMALRHLRAGRGIILAGPVGVGKTSLASAVAQELGSGTRPPSTVWVRATDAARTVQFGALGPLLPTDLSSVHPALVQVLVAERLGGQILVVDDAQLLDDASAATVLALVAQWGVRLLATLRTQSACSDAVTALWKDDLVEWLEVPALDRAGTQALMETHLGGEVAVTSTELLWRRTQGNPLYLSELVRFGIDTGQLVQDEGVWWWRGDNIVPPRLASLMRRRFLGLSPPAQEAVDLLAFGAPLPYPTLAGLVGDGAILELDERGVVASDESSGAVLLRFAHPLFQAAAERRLTPARRAVLAGRLRAAPADHLDIVRRAADRRRLARTVLAASDWWGVRGTTRPSVLGLTGHNPSGKKEHHELDRPPLHDTNRRP